MYPRLRTTESSIMKLALLAWIWTSFLLIPYPIFSNCIANVCLPALTSFLTRSSTFDRISSAFLHSLYFTGPVFSPCLRGRGVLFALFSKFSLPPESLLLPLGPSSFNYFFLNFQFRLYKFLNDRHVPGARSSKERQSKSSVKKGRRRHRPNTVVWYGYM